MSDEDQRYAIWSKGYDAAMEAMHRLGAVFGEQLVRLQTENAAMREIVEAVVGYDMIIGNPGGEPFCIFCGWEAKSTESQGFTHGERCPVTKSRAILGR